MQQDSFFFIVNSRIGEKKILVLREAIKKHLNSQNITLKLTEYGGHATQLAHEAIALPNTIVVAVGGDGTVNEIVQVLAHTDTPMAIVPTGSGNGLARHCHIPITIPEAVALLIDCNTRGIDLGRANERYFISNAGLGFDAVVCNTIKETKSRGLKMYILKVIRQYFNYRKDEYTIVADGKKWTQKAFFLNIANGKEFGYGFEIAPLASLQDGMLDVLIAGNMNFLNGLAFVWSGWRKRLHENRNCNYFRTKKIKIEGKQLKYFQTDGDAHECKGLCEVVVLENALQLIVPKDVENL